MKNLFIKYLCLSAILLIVGSGCHSTFEDEEIKPWAYYPNWYGRWHVVESYGKIPDVIENVFEKGDWVGTDGHIILDKSKKSEVVFTWAKNNYSCSIQASIDPFKNLLFDMKYHQFDLSKVEYVPEDWDRKTLEGTIEVTLLDESHLNLRMGSKDGDQWSIKLEKDSR